MKNELFFSVVIPTYNRAECILQTVESVLAQTYPHFEVIIIDDGSTDNTAAFIETIKDKRLIYHQKINEERSIARNTGTGLAKGDYITFLDSDDLFLPEHLEIAAKKLKEFHHPAFFHSAYEIRNTATGSITAIAYPNDLNAGLINGNFLSCHGIFLDRQAASDNLFNPRLSFMEDWELWLRMMPKHRLAFNPQVTSVLIEHDNRSVSEAAPEKIVSNVLLFLATVLANKTICDYYGRNISKLKSSSYTYIALHVALTGKQKGTAMRYLFKGIALNPGSLFKKRTLAIVKHFILKQ